MDDEPANTQRISLSLKSVFDCFLFSSLFIACAAVLMVYQTDDLLDLHYEKQSFYFFVFFSTICSYNFHWYLTPATGTEYIRAHWTQDHRQLHLVLYLAGLIASAWFAIQLIAHWF